jgi:hypothetical protein
VLLGPDAALPAPEAVLLTPDAVLPWPSAVALAAFASAPDPTAVALVWPAAVEPACDCAPSAVVPALVNALKNWPPAAEPVPRATELSPVALAPPPIPGEPPIATAFAPVEVAPDPIAVE